MVIVNILKKQHLYLVVLFVFVFMLSLSSAALNLTISGNINNGSEEFNADFRAVDQFGAVTGLEGYDFLSPTLTSGYASFSSVIPGNLHLGVDAYEADSVRQRAFNLTFKTSPQISGEFNISWSMSEVYYEAYLTYYGSDSTYTNNVSSRMNMETISSYSDSDLSGQGYLVLEVYYYPPADDEDPVDGGGGGGGGSGPPINPLLRETCNETLICNDWNVCQNLEFSFTDAIIAESDYLSFKKECISKGYDTEICGFQTRSCNIIDQCVNSSLSPIKSQSCYFVVNPSCSDNIKNCHSGDCEVLADCGGPCSPCPTCSDGIKNQGEKKIDCEGPCPNLCEKGITDYISEIEGRQILSVVLYVLVVAVIIGAILFIIYYIKRIKKRVQVDQYSWYNLK